MRINISRIIIGLALALAAHAEVTFIPPAPATIVGDGKTALSTSVNVVLHSTTEVTLVFQSYGFTGPVPLGPSSLTVTAPVKCAAGDYVAVPVAVSGLSRFGTYDGKVEFRLGQDQPGKGIVVPVNVVVKGTISVPPPALTGFRCWFPWSCAAGDFLTPVTRTVLVDNQNGQIPAQINRVEITLRADTGNATLNEQDLGANQNLTVGAGQQGGLSLNMAVPHAKVVAGKYDGLARFWFQNGDSLATPITLTIRDAPLFVILLLAIGIVFGRILQAVNSPTAQAQQRLLTNLASLRSAAAPLSDSDVTLLVEKKMADARQAIATMTVGEQAITQQLQDIGTAITIESNLEWIAANLVRLPAPDRGAIQTDVDKARNLLLSDDLTNADAARKTAQGDLLTKLGTNGLLPGKITAATMAFDTIMPKPPRRRIHARVAAFLAGTPTHLPAGQHPFAKDVMFIALLIGLVVVGLDTIYINNPTFGANRLFDYFGIAVWGLSADVAQRTLQGLQLPK